MILLVAQSNFGFFFSNSLQGGFFGFKLCYEGQRIATYIFNSQIEAVQSVLRAITLGRVARPFDNSPLYNLKLSPVGILPNKRGSYS